MKKIFEKIGNFFKELLQNFKNYYCMFDQPDFYNRADFIDFINSEESIFLY